MADRDDTTEREGGADHTPNEGAQQTHDSVHDPGSGRAHEGGGGDDGHDHHHDDEHHHHDVDDLGVAVVTVSSSRSLEEDPAGDVVTSLVEGEGHEVVTRDLVGDDFDGVQGLVDHLVGRSDVDVVVTSGGTGVTPDDVTVEAVRPLVDKTLPGFGELFRRLSYEEIGTKVVGTRTFAGVIGDAVVFCLPGSENAARLGTEEIVLPEASHLVGLARRAD
jgi:molybdenum cofactor biosynthesis protein B